jgi:hypothetical protein
MSAFHPSATTEWTPQDVSNVPDTERSAFDPETDIRGIQEQLSEPQVFARQLIDR